MNAALQAIFKRGAMCLLGSLCMLQACTQPDGSLNSNFLFKLQEIAPPVIRQCIIDRAKQLPAGEIADKAAHYHSTQRSDEATQALFAVEYLRQACFTDLDIDPHPENGAPWRSPRAFILAIQSHALINSYDRNGLQVLVDAYNVHQDCLFGLVQPCVSKDNKGGMLLTKKALQDAEQNEFPDATYPPRGHTQLRLIETTGLFGLVVTLTDRSHTPAVDDGADHFKTVFFRQADMSLASEYEALDLDLPERALSVLTEGAQADCSGTQYGDDLIVLNGITASEIARIRLPNGAQEIELQRPLGKEAIRLRVRSQQLFADPRENRCELPYWAKHFDYRYTFDCDVEKKKCQGKRYLIRAYQGCANIVACD